MPDDLYGSRRRRLAVRELIACIALALGCSRGGSASPDGSSASEATPARPEATRLVERFNRDGQVAAQALTEACGDPRAYLAVRRAASALLSVWRRRLPMAAEASFGPEVALQEQGGTIGALDRAIQLHDCTAVRVASGKLAGAFRVTDLALASADIPPGTFGQALSDAAYRLGQAVLESTPYVPEADDAALADALGFLDFVDGGARSLGISVTAAATGLEALRTAKALADVTDRASVARATGQLGTAIRQGLRALDGGQSNADLTYRALYDAGDIGVLTLPRPSAPTEPARANLGRQLFFDRRLSRGSARSCATCHIPERAYGDGLVTPRSLVPGEPLRRNTPSLLYAPLEARLMWDGRVRTADRQALTVIHASAEMGATDREVVSLIASDPTYATGLRDAFEDRRRGSEPSAASPEDVGLALASFESRELVPGTAPIDRFARGDSAALSAEVRAGFDVFVGKGRCARCHIPPLFGGSRPPDFTAPVFAVLGVPSSPQTRVIDPDRGRGDGAFRVPTVRNVGRTGPYFHHGRYATLEQVVDFYDGGGGKGLGIAVTNQDPEIRPLHLTANEKRVLLGFMREALDDTR